MMLERRKSGSLCLKGDSKDHDAGEEDVRIVMLERGQ